MAKSKEKEWQEIDLREAARREKALNEKYAGTSPTTHKTMGDKRLERREHTLKIEKVHDDGDLTVKKGDSRYVLTTEGKVFKEIHPKKTSRLHFGPNIKRMLKRR